MRCMKRQQRSIRHPQMHGTMRTYIHSLRYSARVQYMLGTQFLLPPQAHAALLQSCHLYSEALQRVPILQDGVPSASRLDALSNGGYALQALAEVIDEFGCMGSEAACQDTLAKASSQVPLTAAMPAPLYMAASHWFAEVAQGQRQVLQSSWTGSVEDTTVPPPQPDAKPVEDEDEDAYTTSLVAPSSLLESYLDEIRCHQALIPHATCLADIEQLQSAIHSVCAQAQAYMASLEPGFGAAQSPTHAWDEQVKSLELVPIATQIAAMQRSRDMGVALSLESLARLEQTVQAIAATLCENAPPAQSLTAVRLGSDAEARIQQCESHAERLCDVSDYAHDLARIRIQLLAEGDTASAEQAWVLGGCAAKCVLAAVAAFETPTQNAVRSMGLSTSWVPMGSIQPPMSNTSTLISRTRASMYGELASISLTRAHDLLVAAYEPAAGSRAKLLDNARIYARRALADDGLTWVYQVPPPPSEPTNALGEERAVPLINARALAHAYPDGGWESLVRDARLLYTCVRATWLRGQYNGNQENDAELMALAYAMWSLVHRQDAYATLLSDSTLLQAWLDEDVVPLPPREHEFWWQNWRPALTLPSANFIAQQ